MPDRTRIGNWRLTALDTRRSSRRVGIAPPRITGETVVLASLRIRDLAIIDGLEISLRAGLNVLTGETGAGKSIIVGALDLLLGARASGDVVRNGAEQAVVEGLFTSVDEECQSRLRALDLLDLDELGTVVIRRIVSAQGRSRAYVNGSLVNLSTLRDLTEPLVDMTSQHAQYALLRASTHLDMLDRFAGCWPEREAYGVLWADYQIRLQERSDLRRAERDRLEREDFLAFQSEELRVAALQPDEDDAIEIELRRLRNATKLRAGVDASDAFMTGDRGAGPALMRAERAIESLALLEPSLQPLVERVSSLRIEVDDVSFELSRFVAEIDSDPGRLEELEERAALIRGLLRKYGPTVADALQRQRDIAAEQAQLAGADERLAVLDAEIDALHSKLLSAGRALSGLRRAAASRLAHSVQSELAALAMPAARLLVRFRDESADGADAADGANRLGPCGLDRVEFEVATNAGEPLKPLSKSASGGELSRVLLAIKSVLLASDPVATSVFDEVDTGVGGAVAEIIGRKLALASTERQVLCITHLPQIAAFANHHLEVRKQLVDERTVTRVRGLDDSERLAEIARMLGGVEITDRTRAHASEMLRTARTG